jgi:hypothetical protein
MCPAWQSLIPPTFIMSLKGSKKLNWISSPMESSCFIFGSSRENKMLSYQIIVEACVNGGFITTQSVCIPLPISLLSLTAWSYYSHTLHIASSKLVTLTRLARTKSLICMFGVHPCRFCSFGLEQATCTLNPGNRFRQEKYFYGVTIVSSPWPLHILIP